jgi:transcriptional regulator GlxA family with amidase domain
VAQALEQSLISALAACLAARPVNKAAATLRHASIMVRFEQVLAANSLSHLSVPKLCGLLEVSDRTLRSCCAEFLGMSPGAYMFLRRLNTVRIALLGADPVTARVGQIANNNGFTELGRFAVAYRTAFGESPSTTLGRKSGSRTLGPIFAESA